MQSHKHVSLVDPVIYLSVNSKTIFHLILKRTVQDADRRFLPFDFGFDWKENPILFFSLKIIIIMGQFVFLLLVIISFCPGIMGCVVQLKMTYGGKVGRYCIKISSHFSVSFVWITQKGHLVLLATDILFEQVFFLNVKPVVWGLVSTLHIALCKCRRCKKIIVLKITS